MIVGTYPRIGGRADVPPVHGVLYQAFPAVLVDLQPEELGDALFHPAQQGGGGLAPSEEDGLVGGDKRGELGIDRQPPRLLVMEWAPKHPAKMTPP